MTTEKAVEMIDEYLIEPHSIHKDWVEALNLCKKALMTCKEASNLLERAVNFFGEEEQENMCIEECAELIQAINKKHRRKPHNIPEEIADVEITLEQVKIINRCREEVESIKAEKLLKLSSEVRQEADNDNR